MLNAESAIDAKEKHPCLSSILSMGASSIRQMSPIRPIRRASVSAHPCTNSHVCAVPTSASSAHSVRFPTPATPTRKLFKTPITVTAGSEKYPFPLHLEILLTSSPFFAAAYNPSYTFRDSPRSSTSSDGSPDYNTLSLPTISPVDFEYFIQWLYTRTLDHEDLTGPHPAYFKLIRLYGVANQLQITALKNCIVDELATVADGTNSCPTPDDTKNVWDDEMGCGSTRSCLSPAAEAQERNGSNGTGVQAAGGCGNRIGEGAGGGIRELISDLFVWKKTDKLIAEHQDEWDERFLREVVVKLKREKQRGDRAPWRDRIRACKRYHTHDEWAPACGGSGQGD